MKLSSVVVGALGLVGCATSGAPSSIAPPHSDQAQQHPTEPVAAVAARSDTLLDRGLRLYAEQNYAEAARAFEQAYSVEPQPSVLFAQAQALRLAGACGEAKPLYEAFLRDAPDPTYGTVVRTLAAECP